MATIYMDVNIQSTSDNQYYQTRAAVWTEDNQQSRAVFYHIGPVASAEVWEDGNCISGDLAFAIAYLRGAGFKNVPTFESFADYSAIIKDLDCEFNEARYDSLPKPEEKEMPF